jgi:hypothetical protein
MVEELKDIDLLKTASTLKCSGTIGKNCISCGNDISYFPKDEYRLYCLKCFKRAFDREKKELVEG